MRICMVVQTLMKFGGLEEYAVQLADALQQRGHQTALFSTVWVPPWNRYRKFLKKKGVAFFWPVTHLIDPTAYARTVVYALNPSRAWNPMTKPIPASHRKLDRMFWDQWQEQWRPDILHIHGYAKSPYSSLFDLLEWAKERDLPTAYEEHQTPDPKSVWWPQAGESINKASCVLTSSRQSARALRDIGMIRRPIHTMSTIVDDPIYSVGRDTLNINKSGSNLTISAAARLAPYKGLGYLLQAFAEVRKTHPGIRLCIYGEGPLKSELLRYSRKLGLDGKTIFAGAFDRQDLTKVMLQTDIFVLPSAHSEALPAVIIEAMAHGRPILSTEVGGVPDLIEDGLSGLLCQPKDPACLAHKLNRLVEDRELRSRLGQAARQVYEDGPFHPDSVCERHLQVYRETLNLT